MGADHIQTLSPIKVITYKNFMTIVGATTRQVRILKLFRVAIKKFVNHTKIIYEIYDNSKD